MMGRFILVFLVCVMGVGLMSCGDKFSVDYNYEENYEHIEGENVFQYVTFDELKKLMESKGSYIFYLGGAWCPNCQAAAPFMNEVAKELNIKTIYNFDTRLDNASRNMDIRRCNDDSQKEMWEYIVKKLGYTSTSSVQIDGVDVLDSEGNPIPAMSVPTIIVYKDGKMIDYLTREYIYEEMSDELKIEFRNEIKNLLEKR